MQWKLPPPRDFGWHMKPLSSATTAFTKTSDGVYDLTIEHDLIRGVTPQMLLWWFENIGGQMNYQGGVYEKYLVWHPIDHIHWSLAKQAPGGGAGQGASFRIVEAFGGDLNCLIDSVEFVEKLDETGIRLIRKIAGTEIFSLQHDFYNMPGGTKYVSRMIVGTDRFLLKTVFNRLVRPFIFTEQMGHLWLKHNVEEVGNFEFFLPEHYEQKCKRLAGDGK